MAKVSFNNSNAPFFTSIKTKVNEYFTETNISSTGGNKLYIKSVIQFLSAVTIYFWLLFFNPGNFISILLCILLGINFAVIGFNIMHEAGHNTFSKSKWINNLGSYSLNLMGGSIFFWKIKHNINHHTFTNIEGLDSDIDNQPFLRMHSTQQYYKMHKFQHFYCLILYGLSYFAWIFYNDFKKYFTGKIGQGKYNKLEFNEHLIFWSTKVFYIVAYLIIPMMILGVAKAFIGFGIVLFVTGLCTAIVFQLAHVVEGTAFVQTTGESHKIEQEWAVHQVCTTANFATNNKFISWMLGGLNFQVEHHLFPRISHVHYPKINEFVKEACEEYNVTYLEYSTMLKAIRSHFSHIKKMGEIA